MAAIGANPLLSQPLFDTARLHLRPLRPGDLARITMLADDADISDRTAAIPHPYKPHHAEYWLTNSRAERERGEAITYAIALKDSDEFIGGISLTLMAGPERSILLGYWLGRAYWGYGYATEAVRRALHFIFTDLDRVSAYALVLPGNEASLRVLDKLGFAPCGTENLPAEERCRPAFGRRVARADFLAAQPVKRMLFVVAAALIDSDGRILLAQRPEGKALAGLWEFPGGKVADGETPEAALVRELTEELGITVHPSCLAPFAFASHTYPDFHLLMPLYLCRVWDGEPQGQEGQALAWVRPTRLHDYAMPPADVPLVAQLRAIL
jgi:8-oxo-dGTP diphosphatase